MPHSGEIASQWRLKKQRYELQGHSCVTCGKPVFGRQFCPTCSSPETAPQSIELPIVAAEIINQLASEE